MTSREFPESPAPHMHPLTSVPVVMRSVLYALTPAVVVTVWVFGPGIVVNMAIAAVSAAATEATILKLRQRAIRPGLADGSALVTAALIAFALPPLLPWWIPALAAGIAILLGKQLFGGLGSNPFNPAMVGYVVVLLSFPAEMIQWLAPRGVADPAAGITLGSHLAFTFTGILPETVTVDAITQATPLDLMRLGLANMQTVDEVSTSPLFGALGGKGWQLSSVAVALGGLYLLARRVIGWRIPVAVLAGVAIPALLFHLIDTSRFAGPGHHLFNGATMLGAFFIATDPVTAAASDRGKVYYGAGIGVLTYAIRTWGGYADGLAFAVLLMNATVPLLDQFTRPRVYGRGRA